MLCPNCGKDVGDTVLECENCRNQKKQAPLDTAIKNVSAVVQPIKSEAQSSFTEPAGFWLRGIAWAIDGGVLFLINIVCESLFRVSLIHYFESIFKLFFERVFLGSSSPQMGLALIVIIPIIMVFAFLLGMMVVTSLYMILMECSKLQATVGKLVVGIKVTDKFGKRLTILRAIGRLVAKFLSVFPTTGVGFVMAAFTANKRALHDMISGTLVVKSKRISVPRLVFSVILALVCIFVIHIFNGKEQSKNSFRINGNSKITFNDQNSFGQIAQTNSLEKKTTKRYYFTNSQAPYQIALWDPASSVLQIGYFSKNLEPADHLAIKNANALDVIAENKPEFILKFTLIPGSRLFAVESLKEFMVILSEKAVSKSLSGGKGGIARAMSPGTFERKLVTPSGELTEGSLLEGITTDSYTIPRNDSFVGVSWKFEINANVIVAQATGEAKALALPSQIQEPSGAYARVMLGKREFELRNAVVMTDADTHEVSIGFYLDDLSQDEKLRVVKEKLLWSYVNGKRPNFILTLDFDRTKKELSAETLMSYSVYFYKEAAGHFYFPGDSDRKRFTYNAHDASPERVARVKGVFAEGDITVVLSGSEAFAGEEKFFSWNVSLKSSQ